MSKNILILVSEWGYWGEELIGPIDVFGERNYQVTFATPTGARPTAVPVSKDASYIDPPLGHTVTSKVMAKKVEEIDNPNTEQGKKLSNPVSIEELMPTRPYWSDPHFLDSIEKYNHLLKQSESKLSDYDALLIVGGNGPIVDLVNNQRVHDIILAFYKSGKPIASECYGTTCLVFARDINNRKSILKGKRVTGHPIEYDYRAGYSFTDPKTNESVNFGAVPYPLEYLLRDAVEPDGEFIGNFGKEMSVIVDYPFLTGRSTSDGVLIGEKLVEVLENGLIQSGWGNGELYRSSNHTQ